MIIVVCGLPGSGKTTVSSGLAKVLGASLISSDVLRKEAMDRPGYSEEEKFFVYRLMLEKAKDLATKEDVVLDATFYRNDLRERARTIAEEAGRSFYLVECKSDDEIVKKRLEGRAKRKNSKSDADFDVYLKLKNLFEPIPENHILYKGDKKEIPSIANEIHLAELKKFLSKKEVYGAEASREIEVKETHISLVFLNGNFAYKVKKPVNLGFLDYSLLAKRKFFCEEELRINSMLSKDLYKGIVEIRRGKGLLAISNEGRIVDYAIRMMQLPESNMLEKLLAENKVDEKIIKEIASQISEFHSKADSGREVHEFGKPENVWKAFSNAFSVSDLIGEDAKVVEEKAKLFLGKNKVLFEKRAKEGMIKNCHGDLHSGNIFIYESKPYIFDAIEFSKPISCCDVAAEIAFLAMDLEFHKRKDLADIFVKEYERLTNDHEIEKLIVFYKCYRAAIRMMVNGMQKEKMAIAKEYARLAKEYALEL